MQEQMHAQSGRSYAPGELLAPDDVARAVCDVLDLPRGAAVTDLTLRPTSTSVLPLHQSNDTTAPRAGTG
jgi:NADP-dependent 3-hydroxy acid dehydrogenase YdfG